MLRSCQQTLTKVFSSLLLYRGYAAVASLEKPLHIFVCAADEASDSAGAHLIASLKQIHRQGVHVYGVGGPLLRAQGLRSVVSDEQYHQLATAEVVQQAYGLQKLQGFSLASKKEYLKIFRDAIWEAALHGCSSQNILLPQTSPQAEQAKLQQQQQRSTITIGQAQLPASLSYDAIVTIGSATASQQVLFVLRKAEEQKKARLPVVVQYMVPGLWDYQQVSAAAAAWAKLTDHVMCSLPFEPELLHKSGGHASFVGHPVLEALLQQKSFGSRKALVAQLLQAKAAASTASQTAARSSSGGGGSVGYQQQQQQFSTPVGQLFAVGDAAAFWRVFDSMYSRQHSSSSSNEEDVHQQTTPVISSSSPRRKAPATAAAAGISQDINSPSAAAHQQQHHNSNRLLLCLLPGNTEAEICSSMPAFDDMTKQLSQRFPHLVAAMIVPDLLVEAGVQATNNFVLPVVVLPAGSTHSTNALAAAAAALSHPGPESLRAVAAGVPMVCVRDGSLLREGFSSWRRGGVLPFGCIPNLVLGCKAVPEYNLWVRGAREEAVAAVAQLLTENAQRPAATAAAAAAGSSSSSSSSRSEANAQRSALQDVLLQLAPHQHHQPLVSQGSRRSASSSGSPAAVVGSVRVSVQAPGDAAASMLLQLVALRKQQEAEQVQALKASQQAQGSL